MVAGTKYRGEFEERIKRVIEEVTADRNIILFVDELHTLIGAGGAEGSLDASNILKPSLSRGEVQLIGATTITEYRKYVEKDAALERRFQPVQIEEPTPAQTIEILKGIVHIYEEHHGVKVEEEALQMAVDLSVRYINDRNLPDKAIDVIDEACAAVRLNAGDGGGNETTYVTEYGECYHNDPGCIYLNPQIREIPVSEVDHYRSGNGAKYYPCECCKPGKTGTVYITKEGNRYHSDRDCGGIVRHLETMDEEAAKSHYRPCPKCGGSS